MRRVGIKRCNSEDIGSWDLPPSKRPRVEPRAKRGSRLWTRITSSVSDILSSVKRLFNRSHDSNTCPPLMNETDVSTPHTSPTPSQPSSPPPQSPSPKLTHHSTSQQHTPPLLPTTTTTTCSLPLSLPQQISSYSNIPLSRESHLTNSTTHPNGHTNSTTHPNGHTNSTTHPNGHTNSTTHHDIPNGHTNSTTHHDIPNGQHHSHNTGLHSIDHNILWSELWRPQKSLSEQCTSIASPSTTSILWTTPSMTSSLKPLTPPIIPRPSHTVVDTSTPEIIGPKLRGKLFSPTTIGHQHHNTYHTTTTQLTQLSSRTQHLPSLPHCDILQRRKWVESVKADHTHSLTQHRAAVELELKRLAECREQRFKAEDSRVKHLQDSVRNMSLLSNFSLDDEDDEIKNEMIPLTEEQEKMVKRTLTQGSGLEIISQKFNISIKRDDIRTLTGLNWLNDEVINFYMNLIVERGKEDATRCSVHAMNSFFYPKLCDVGYSGVRRWTKKIDIFSVDLVLYPIHLGTHWCVAVIDNNQHTLSYYDSLGGQGRSCLARLRAYLVAEHMDKKKKELCIHQWRYNIQQDIPLQRNGSDCGVFTCMYARYLASNIPFTFTQNKMPEIRRHMICELLEQKLF